MKLPTKHGKSFGQTVSEPQWSKDLNTRQRLRFCCASALWLDGSAVLVKLRVVRRPRRTLSLRALIFSTNLDKPTESRKLVANSRCAIGGEVLLMKSGLL